MAFKMKGHSLPGIKQRKSPAKHTDTVDKGSNRNPEYAATHNNRHAKGDTHGEIGSKDNKWAVGTESTQSPAKQEDSKPSKAMQDKMAEVKAANLAETNKILRGQGKDEVGEIKKSPAKCPLIAALPAITAGISAIGAMKKKKEE
tara:strand:+ start:871 stop:1305 length:435 start_codon:yes stop_codon:yes gene_type:complete